MNHTLTDERQPIRDELSIIGSNGNERNYKMVELSQNLKTSTIRGFDMITKKLSIFVSALILYGMFVSGCGVTTESIEDGNIYENEKHGYSFRYPSDCFYGPMPSDCKQKPPEERRPECLCFLNSENPDQVSMEKLMIGEEEVTMAAFHIHHYDTPLFNPPPGTELVKWLKEGLSDMLENIPNEPNMEIGGIPGVRILTPQSPMAPSYEEIFYINHGLLFRINMINVDNEESKALYDHMLSTFRFEE